MKLCLLLVSAISVSGCDCGSDGSPPGGDGDGDADADGDGDGDGDTDSDGDGDADPTPCIDADGDTYGADCDAGEDCDDADANHHFGCDAECAGDPTAMGCPCAAGDPSPTCYGGAPGTVGIGACVAGQRTCDHAEWGPCDGEVQPRAGGEICDDTDDDCDGTVDNGVLSECGDCDPACRLDEQGHGDYDQDAMDGVVDDELADGLIITTETREAGYAWIANDPDGSASKVDLITGEEVGRFYVGHDNLSNRPSRTAVDGFGDAYIASRAHNGGTLNDQASINKVAADERDCLDRNGNNQIDTSRDNVALARGTDECVIWTTDIGPVGTWARGLTLDAGDLAHPEGYVWVAGFNDRVGLGANEGRAFRVNPEDGTFVDIDAGDALVASDGVQLPLNPYGAAADASGRIWFTDITGGDLVYVDVATGAVSALIDKPSVASCEQSYGLAIDGDGRIWTAGWTCTTVWGYDPSLGEWSWIALSGRGRTRGVAVDGLGNVWVTHNTSPGAFSSFPADSFVAGAAMNDNVSTLVSFPAGQNGPIGAGIDYQGRIWGVNQTSDNATVYDPADGTFVTYPTNSSFIDPYTYSDFTGFQRRNFTAPRGTYEQVYEGDCYIGLPDWGPLTWNVTTPAETAVRFEVQTAAEEDELDAAPIVAVAEIPPDAPPVDIGDALDAAGVVPENLLRLTIVLLSLDRETTPVVHDFSLSWECAGD